MSCQAPSLRGSQGGVVEGNSKAKAWSLAVLGALLPVTFRALSADEEHPGDQSGAGFGAGRAHVCAGAWGERCELGAAFRKGWQGWRDQLRVPMSIPLPGSSPRKPVIWAPQRDAS